jgi:hypothetical protein
MALLALVCLCLFAAVAWAEVPDAQDGKSQLIVPLQSGAYVVITTEAVPPSARETSTNFIEAEDKPNLIHRVFVDRKNELFFGYELLVEPLAKSRQFRVTVRPLSAEYLEQLRARPAFQKRQLHPSYNAAAFPATPQVVAEGDTFALDVLQNPRTGTKIVDVIKVTLDNPSLQEPSSERPPRDFTLEDIQLKVTNYKLRVNGETVYRSTGGGCAGALVWFSLRERGRFIFSLIPRAGYAFQKIGAIQHNKITFEWEGDRYEWESSLPVVGVGGNWNLWVLHDPDYNFDLFDQMNNRPDAARPNTSAQDEAMRQMKSRRPRAEFGAPAEQPQPKPATAPKPRVRVIIGAADEAEYLFPKL